VRISHASTRHRGVLYAPIASQDLSPLDLREILATAEASAHTSSATIASTITSTLTSPPAQPPKPKIRRLTVRDISFMRTSYVVVCCLQLQCLTSTQHYRSAVQVAASILHLAASCCVVVYCAMVCATAVLKQQFHPALYCTVLTLHLETLHYTALYTMYTYIRHKTDWQLSFRRGRSWYVLRRVTSTA
jgi:hypothetical protein